jgi:hypothetical protein
MSDPLSKSDVLARLISTAVGQGLKAASPDAGTVVGEQDTILSKWFLGGRKVAYKFSCRLDDAASEVRFREVVKELSWGVPPPTMTVEKTSQRGTRVSESRTDRGVGGGGTLEYGRLREAIERSAGDAGWKFTFEVGRMP